MNRFCLCFLVLLCSVRVPATAQTSDSNLVNLTNSIEPPERTLAGDWRGGFEGPEAFIGIVVHFHAEKDGVAGTIDNFNYEVYPFAPPGTGIPLVNLRLNSSQIHFETGRGTSFDGIFKPGLIAGKVNWSGKTIPFQLVHLANSMNVNVAQYAGCYELQTDHFIAVYMSSIYPDRLFSLDSRTGEVCYLIPDSATTFAYSSNIAQPFSADAVLQFMTNSSGQTAGMEYRAKHATPITGQSIKLRTEEVSFTNGEVVLKGTLTLPPSSGRHATIIFLHGSGPRTARESRIFAEFFALNGVAALEYDKRGVGASTGDWQKSTFVDLAGDALSGLDMLKHHPDVDPRQIGLWGMSQGGWLTALAAARSTNVAFIISISGPGVTPEEQGAYMVEHRMQTAGFAKDDVKNALQLYRWNSRCARTGTGWNEFNAALKIARREPWYKHDIDPYDQHDQEAWRLIWDYDPVPDLEKIHCPVLAFFGKLDPLLPPEKSAAIWKATLARAGNKDVTIRTFPRGDHTISDPSMGHQQPEFFTFQRDWLSKHFNASDGVDPRSQ